MQLEALFNKLKHGRRIVAPVSREGYFVYETVHNFKEIAIDFTLPIYPPKEVMLPQHEPVYSFKGANVRATIPSEKTVIFGVRPCDVRAIGVMDNFMFSGIAEPYYKARRENTLIVAIQCAKQFENCFCDVFGSFKLEKGHDIGLARGSGGYLIKAGSKLGEDTLKSLKIKQDSKLPQANFKITKPHQQFKARIGELDKLSDSKHWDTAATECFSCGGCTIVCPTCQCFDIEDHSAPNLATGKRIRTWDSCQLKPFTRVAGKYHFRGKRTDRFRHRYYHKLVWGDNCVGCGRCVTICPTKIDMREVVLKL